MWTSLLTMIAFTASEGFREGIIIEGMFSDCPILLNTDMLLSEM